MNYSSIFTTVWSFFCMPLVFGDFSITYGQVFLFTVLVGFTIAALRFLWG